VRIARAAALLAICVAAGRPAGAELAYFSSGDSLSIRDHRVDGESLVLTLRAGGETLELGVALQVWDFTLPDFTPAFAAELLRYAMAAVAIGGVLWLVSLFTKSRGQSEATS